jgi:hypothetical protein
VLQAAQTRSRPGRGEAEMVDGGAADPQLAEKLKTQDLTVAVHDGYAFEFVKVPIKRLCLGRHVEGLAERVAHLAAPPARDESRLQHGDGCFHSAAPLRLRRDVTVETEMAALIAQSGHIIKMGAGIELEPGGDANEKPDRGSGCHCGIGVDVERHG